MRNAFTSEQARLPVLVRALALSVLLCLAFSWRLWLSARLYPLVPVLGVVPRFPWPLDALVVAAAVFEVLFGLGLLTSRFRGFALRDALAMHAVILVCIGPLRGDWNDSA